jgi:hypothetical protein
VSAVICPLCQAPTVPRRRLQGHPYLEQPRFCMNPRAHLYCSVDLVEARAVPGVFPLPATPEARATIEGQVERTRELVGQTVGELFRRALQGNGETVPKRPPRRIDTPRKRNR